MRTSFTQALFLKVLLLVSPSLLAATDAEVVKSLEQVSRKISKTLPSGSPASMLVAVTAGPGKKFTYFSVSSTASGKWTPAMKAHSRRIAINSYCTDPGMEAFKSFGVTVSFNAVDQEGVHINTNNISPKDCRKI